MKVRLYTIGHSAHTLERFVELLSIHAVSAVADVRSHPYSRFAPQFNREALREALKKFDIHYVFLGDELGVRSREPKFYHNGKVQYAALAASTPFVQGLARVEQGLANYQIALMCAEKDPIACHRAILVGRQLRAKGILIEHIHQDGSLESQSALEERLLGVLNLPAQDLFTTHQEMIERAYDLQAVQIAYTQRTGERDGQQEAWLSPDV